MFTNSVIIGCFYPGVWSPYRGWDCGDGDEGVDRRPATRFWYQNSKGSTLNTARKSKRMNFKKDKLYSLQVGGKERKLRNYQNR